jgi:hypothetical protein
MTYDSTPGVAASAPLDPGAPMQNETSLNVLVLALQSGNAVGAQLAYARLVTSTHGLDAATLAELDQAVQAGNADQVRALLGRLRQARLSQTASDARTPDSGQARLIFGLIGSRIDTQA